MPEARWTRDENRKTSKAVGKRSANVPELVPQVSGRGIRSHPLISLSIGPGGAKREGTLTGSERTGNAWRERTQVDA